MRRKIYQNLLEWKKERKGDVALLIEGARRIGKSYIVEEFARNEYDSYILVDFSKVNPQVMEFFNLYLDDLNTLFLNLELYFRKKPRLAPSLKKFRDNCRNMKKSSVSRRCRAMRVCGTIHKPFSG
ncbi:AAA family ATPase [Bacteroides sp. UBA939]|uniref:AAA family ATPase n=1 Tax=Bacteroides sp. UBA939 TaxID=1946092 RepID=UPI0025C025E2|nr:AAA family ATPase [Bacteroides sp. UBA939]